MQRKILLESPFNRCFHIFYTSCNIQTVISRTNNPPFSLTIATLIVEAISRRGNLSLSLYLSSPSFLSPAALHCSRSRRAGRNPVDNKRTSRAFVHFHRMRQTFVISLSLYLGPAPGYNKGSNAWRLEIFPPPLAIILSLPYEGARRPINRIVTFSPEPIMEGAQFMPLCSCLFLSLSFSHSR